MLAAEYAELKGFLLFFTTHVKNVRPTPTGNILVDELNRMEARSPSKARQSLRMMINDSLEMAGDWPLEKVKAFDHELHAAGVITLSELRHRYSRQYAKILSRGSIGNQVEYYLLKGILDGLTSSLDKSEQALLMRIISEYEDEVGRAI